MAVSQSYQCEFIDSIPEDFYCKKCSLVARKLTVTSCCTESFCHACIADTQQQGKPCPECGEKSFTTLQLTKYQRRIEGLQVYCSMRRRGCGWSGTIKQLSAHLDPDQDNCQHVDTKCPLNCQQTIPKKKIEQHVAKECVKRDFICQYCAFKATYEEVVNMHLPECIYVPLQCPNLCGVTCERDVMEDHMKMCRLEEVACEFSGVGCDETFIREDQEEHTRQNSQKHITLMVTASLNSKQHLQQKLQEQEQKLQEQEKKFQEHEQKLQEQNKEHQAQDQILREQLYEQKQKLLQQEENFKKILQEQESKFNKKLEELGGKFEKKLEEQKKEIEQKHEFKFHEEKQKSKEKLQEQEHQYKKLLQEQDKKLKLLREKSDQNEATLAEVSNFSLRRTFTMTDFSKEKVKDKPGDWKSPAMYTHLCGYKFCIVVNANGSGYDRGTTVDVELWPMQGEYDYHLKWPAKASFTIELHNQQGGDNVKFTPNKLKWEKPKIGVFHFSRIVSPGHYYFIEHSKLKDFLHNDTLYFHLTDITVCF